ncbi:MAG: hypothetical protein WDM79_17575 [Terricaulis sp.]
MPDDPESIEELLETSQGQEFQVDIAGLSTAEQANVANALREAADDGALGDVNLDSVILDAQAAEDARSDAEYYQAEQAKAVDAGDWETAKDFAEKAEYSMEEVQDHGGDVAYAEVLEAEHDQMNLDNADWNQEIADDNAVTAEAYAESGDLATAEIYADSAASAAETAADYGAAGDQGGSYADQTVDTSSTYDASATVATVDTSASTVVDTSASTVDTSTATE